MISQTSEYALRATLFLATRSQSGPATAQDIAEATMVPVGYLQKILRMLTRHGLLTAHRGVNGGFALAKVASAISVLDILNASDSRIQRIERCPLGITGHARLCSLHKLLDAEMARTSKTFASTSLADLLDQEGDDRPLCDPTASPGVRVPITSPKPGGPNQSGS